MAVKVCDSIMGGGKSSASITYMNEHKDSKFIYITPYLDEAERIKKGCPSLKFVEPSDKFKEFHYRKTEHAISLIKQGKNITTTHQAFKRYDADTLEDIQRQEYTLIIDENVDVLEKFDFNPGDLQMAIDAGYIEESNGVYSLTGKEYSGSALREMFSLLSTRDLIKMEDEKGDESLFYWALPPSLITSFKDVFILTYMFEGQSLHHFMEIYNIPYEYIGIEKRGGADFSFGSLPGYTPEYVRYLKDMIIVEQNEKLNEIGDDYHALSINWFERNKEEVQRLKNNIYNYMNNIWSDVPTNNKLWGTFERCKEKIKGKGYTNSYLVFNTKATNNYRNRTRLAYPVNIFMNVNEKKFYAAHGIEADDNAYALSIMVQWIWRSAIRDGKEIHIYIPSRRMREMLISWMNNLSKGGNMVDSRTL